MSLTSNSQLLPIDFSALKFSTPIIDEDEDSEDENGYDNEYAFTKEYIFTVDDPNPPPPAPQARNPFGFMSNSWVEPLVKIRVRTIDRKKIPSGQFYLYMDEICEDFLQFSMGVFNKAGHIKPLLYQLGSPNRGTGVWGPEINRGTLAYIEEIRVSSKYQRRGVGRWAVENVLQSDLLAHCPFFFLWAAVCSNGNPFAGPDPDFESKKQAVISFWRAVGFRRVGGSCFFGYARNPQHPMRSLSAADDARETQVKDYTSSDAFDACVTVTYG